MSKRSRREFLKELLALGGVAASVAVLRWYKSGSSESANEASAPETLLTDSGVEMMHIEAGEFIMGCGDCKPNEQPVHTVILTHSFYLARHTVTFEQYNAYCGQTGQPLMDDRGWGHDVPMFGLNWFDAVEYCNWLSEREGLIPCYGERSRSSNNSIIWDYEADGYRLPTEAEWEYAARGGPSNQDYFYPGSDDPNEVAWYADNSDGRPHPVGQKMPNALGLYDMSGNVSEFCWDLYTTEYYRYITGNLPAVDPLGMERMHTYSAATRPNISLRGGNFMSPVDELRVTARGYDVPLHYGMYGIRLARTGAKKEDV